MKIAAVESLAKHHFVDGLYLRHGKRTEMAVRRFIDYAKANPNLKFLVTPIGCGNGGWQPKDMAGLFADAVGVENICLPRTFWQNLV